MSVLIKGMEMPEVEDGHLVRIISASIHVYANGDEPAALYVHYKDKPPERYALVPVPQHGDLVDKQRMAETNEQHYKIYEGDPSADYARRVVLRMLGQAPTVIPADKEAADG